MTNQERECTKEKIPRPMNCFFIYRREKQQLLQEEMPGENNQTISMIIGKMWKEEPSDVKLVYKKRAEQEKQLHASLYPGYRYVPRRNSSKDKNARGIKSTQEFMVSQEPRLNLSYNTFSDENTLETHNLGNFRTNENHSNTYNNDIEESVRLRLIYESQRRLDYNIKQDSSPSSNEHHRSDFNSSYISSLSTPTIRPYIREDHIFNSLSCPHSSQKQRYNQSVTPFHSDSSYLARIQLSPLQPQAENFHPRSQGYTEFNQSSLGTNTIYVRHSSLN